MKKMMITMLAALMIVGSATAQDRQRPSKEEMAKMRTERMAERYGLNEAQKAKLLELNTEYADVMRPMGPPPGMQRPGNGERPQAAPGNGERPQGGQGQGNRPRFGAPNPEMQQRMAEYETKLEKILTPDQMAKYNEDKANFRQHRGRPGQQ